MSLALCITSIIAPFLASGADGHAYSEDDVQDIHYYLNRPYICYKTKAYDKYCWVDNRKNDPDGIPANRKSWHECAEMCTTGKRWCTFIVYYPITGGCYFPADCDDMRPSANGAQVIYGIETTDRTRDCISLDFEPNLNSKLVPKWTPDTCTDFHPGCQKIGGQCNTRYLENVCPKSCDACEIRDATHVLYTTADEGVLTDNTDYLFLTPNKSYYVKIEILRNDLGQASEYATGIEVNGVSVGQCHPDGGDYDCTFFTCYEDVKIHTDNTGRVDMKVSLTGHSHDCDCDIKTWECERESAVLIGGRKAMTAVARFTFTEDLDDDVPTGEWRTIWSCTSPPNLSASYNYDFSLHEHKDDISAIRICTANNEMDCVTSEDSTVLARVRAGYRKAQDLNNGCNLACIKSKWEGPENRLQQLVNTCRIVTWSTTRAAMAMDCISVQTTAGGVMR